MLETPKLTHLLDFLSYQSKTRFQGLRLRQQAYQADPQIQSQSQKIYSGSLQLVFIYLQVSLFTAHSVGELLQSDRLRKFVMQLGNKGEEVKEVVKVVKGFKEPLDGIECVIYLTLRQIFELIQRLDLFNKVQGVNSASA